MGPSLQWIRMTATATIVIIVLVIVIPTCNASDQVMTWSEADALEAEKAAKASSVVNLLQEEFKQLRWKAKELSDENDELVERHKTLSDAIREVQAVRISAEKTIQSLEEDEAFYREQVKERLGEESCENGQCP